MTKSQILATTRIQHPYSGEECFIFFIFFKIHMFSKLIKVFVDSICLDLTLT